MKLSLLVSMVLCGSLCSMLESQENKKLATSPPGGAAKTTISGEAFLSANKKKSGVVTLRNGLQYKILVAGAGERPKAQDTVIVNYTGTLVDGTEFDSSYKHNMPSTFPLTAVIPGWTQALQLMSVGSTWELYIPAKLAYGASGAPPFIGPNQTLIFKIELIGIKRS